MGRPRKEITEQELRTLLRLTPRLVDVAAYFECSADTIEQRCKEYGGGTTFREFREQCMVHTRLQFRREAVRLAMAGNERMLLFCLKHYCDMVDKAHLIHEGGDNPIKTEVDININKPEREVFDLARVKRALQSERFLEFSMSKDVREKLMKAEEELKDLDFDDLTESETAHGDRQKEGVPQENGDGSDRGRENDDQSKESGEVRGSSSQRGNQDPERGDTAGGGSGVSNATAGTFAGDSSIIHRSDQSAAGNLRGGASSDTRTHGRAEPNGNGSDDRAASSGGNSTLRRSIDSSGGAGADSVGGGTSRDRELALETIENLHSIQSANDLTRDPEARGGSRKDQSSSSGDQGDGPEVLGLGLSQPQANSGERETGGGVHVSRRSDEPESPSPEAVALFSEPTSVVSKFHPVVVRAPYSIKRVSEAQAAFETLTQLAARQGVERVPTTAGDQIREPQRCSTVPHGTASQMSDIGATNEGGPMSNRSEVDRRNRATQEGKREPQASGSQEVDGTGGAQSGDESAERSRAYALRLRKARRARIAGSPNVEAPVDDNSGRNAAGLQSKPDSQVVRDNPHFIDANGVRRTKVEFIDGERTDDDSGAGPSEFDDPFSGDENEFDY